MSEEESKAPVGLCTECYMFHMDLPRHMWVEHGEVTTEPDIATRVQSQDQSSTSASKANVKENNNVVYMNPKGPEPTK